MAKENIEKKVDILTDQVEDVSIKANYTIEKVSELVEHQKIFEAIDKLKTRTEVNEDKQTETEKVTSLHGLKIDYIEKSIEGIESNLKENRKENDEHHEKIGKTIDGIGKVVFDFVKNKSGDLFKVIITLVIIAISLFLGIWGTYNSSTNKLIEAYQKEIKTMIEKGK
ncbi:MAG: hypothetical protein GY853_13935 [PVC group bacterium]|nr:hypothetical protein [PVC group bacterium]